MNKITENENDGILFRVKDFADRLSALRNGENKQGIKYSQKELVKEIDKKTGVSISPGQYSKYESGENPQMPNINFLLAIAKFFDVTVDYLIGESNSASDNLERRALGKKFNLTNETMDKMEYMLNHTDINLPINYKKCGEMDLINFVISNFSQYLLSDILDYTEAYEQYKSFMDKYAQEQNGKKSENFLEIDGLPIGSEDVLIDECRELKGILDIKKMNLINSMERFLLKFRKAYIKQEDNNANN